MVRETSIEAYNYIKENGFISKARFDVYEHLFYHGPCTAKQVVIAFVSSGIDLRGTVTPRFSELKNLGIIKEVGTTKCEESGHRVILWDVTNFMPEKKFDKLVQRIRNKKVEVYRLKIRLKKKKEEFEKLISAYKKREGIK